MTRTTAALALAALVALPAASASAHPATLNAVAIQTAMHRSGSQISFGARLIHGGKTIGDERITCHFRKSHDLACAGTVTLATGTITIRGIANNQPYNVVSITGGTGAYASAHGKLKMHDLNPAGTRTQLTFTFS